MLLKPNFKVLLVGLCTTGLDGLAKIDWPALIGEERRDPP